MNLRDRQRIFSLRYRKSADRLFREKECCCDLLADGIHHVGDIWHEEQGNDIWVHLAVDYFESPDSKYAKDRVDKLFDRCELSAEQWIQSQRRCNKQRAMRHSIQPIARWSGNGYHQGGPYDQQAHPTLRRQRPGFRQVVGNRGPSPD